MSRNTIVLMAAVFGIASAGVSRAGQHDAHQSPGQAPQTSGDVALCTQGHAAAARLIDVAKIRLEAARQSNSAAAMRDAVDDFQTVLVDISAQIAPCARLQPAAADAHAGHAMPTAPPAPAATPPAVQKPPAVTPTPAAPKAPADPHVGHQGATGPAPSGRLPSARSQPRLVAPTSAAPDHAAHPAGAAEPAASNAHAAHKPAPAATSGAGSSLLPLPAMALADLKCGTAVDPKTAPRMLYQGRMYYFCTERERAMFAKDPGQYATPPPQRAPAHVH
jgi:YHS domain-containing protein